MESQHSYKVLVDDNFHYQDESDRYVLGEFVSCQEAISACERIIDEDLRSVYQPGMTADQLWHDYMSFGEDPFISTTDSTCKFSAWEYARSRCESLCQG